MDRQLLNDIGFKDYSLSDFYKKSITLRDGRNTNLLVHELSGHGILDRSLWVKEDFYREKYRTQFSSNWNGKKQECEKNLKLYKKLNDRQFGLFEKFLNEDTDYLEVGCSFGGIVSRVYDRGVNKCHVVEPNVEDTLFVKNNYPDIKVFNSTFEDVKLVEGSYDIIVAFDVVEHVYFPGNFINKCYQLLKDGGRLIIVVPNHNDVLLSNYDCDNYKNFYYHKAHINYFTPDSIKYLCESVGFKGQVGSYLDYSFFNHVFWYQNDKPMGNSEGAFINRVINNNDTLSKKINNFYNNVEVEYEKLINDELAGGALIFNGVKNV